MKIFLIGFMGSGKTTHGRKLARRLGYDFIDLDNFIEEKQSRSIPEIFSHFGEERFRLMEAENLKLLESIRDVIISTGGGTPCHFDNMAWMNASGLTIYLKMSPKALYSRLKNSKRQRPLIHGKSKDELLNYITHTLEKRKIFYEMSKLIVEADGLRVKELESLIKEELDMHDKESTFKI